MFVGHQSGVSLQSESKHLLVVNQEGAEGVRLVDEAEVARELDTEPLKLILLLGVDVEQISGELTS